jgi:hypothetical protein
MSFSTPDYETPTVEETPNTSGADEQAKRDEKKKKGRASTILTGGLGTIGGQTTKKKTLLGG